MDRSRGQSKYPFAQSITPSTENEKAVPLIEKEQPIHFYFEKVNLTYLSILDGLPLSGALLNTQEIGQGHNGEIIMHWFGNYTLRPYAYVVSHFYSAYYLRIRSDIHVVFYDWCARIFSLTHVMNGYPPAYTTIVAYPGLGAYDDLFRAINIKTRTNCRSEWNIDIIYA